MPRKRERLLVRPVEELREIVLVLHEAFADVCASEGVRSTMRGNWQRLFESMDEDERPRAARAGGPASGGARASLRRP